MSGQKRIIIEIGGKSYNLVFSFNAMCMIETVGGMRELLGQGAAAKNLTGCRAVLWATINASHTRDITIEEAGDLCDQYITENGGLQALITKVNSLFNDAGWNPKKKEGDDAGKNPNPTPGQSGKSSKNTNASLTGSAG